MDIKGLSGFEIKNETLGQVEAVFATLGVKDKDGDVTNSGAFENGAECIISAYGHKSWEGALPVGTATIHEVGDKVMLKGQFFMDTTHGRDHFNTVKALGKKGEWSYGYHVDDSEPGNHKGENVRVLKKMTVFEVSPVFRGAGEGTMTTSAKADTSGSSSDGAADKVRAAISAAGNDPKARAAAEKLARSLQLSNLIPASWSSGKSLAEEISFAVEAARDAVKSATRVAALRADSGKSLSNITQAGLDELENVLLELAAVITPENESKHADTSEITKLYLASIAANLEGE